MSGARTLLRAALVVGVTLAVLVGCSGATPPVRPGRGATVTVMTQNIYLGGDIDRPIRAATGRTGPAGLLALGHAAAELRAVVDRTDFSVRGRLLAQEIADHQPDLVGLQEVALWRHGPLQLEPGGAPQANQVDQDFLAMLLADLHRRGSDYTAASVQIASDVEAPAFEGPLTSAPAGGRDIRLTDRDVILVRQDAGVRIEGHGGGQYRARLDLTLGGGAVALVRGYTWVDAEVRGHRLRFLNTHLEAEPADLGRAQAQELIDGPAAAPGATVLVCDCNSNPARSDVRAGDHVPRNAAYQLITGSGFDDQWLRQPQTPGPGWTAGLGELVNDPTAAGFTRRIDLGRARPAPGGVVRADRGQVVGDQPAARDPATGLWPSDHAGVVLQLTLP